MPNDIKTDSSQPGAPPPAGAANENWICYECAAAIVNSGGRPLQAIWGANQTPHRAGQCSKCGKVETLCMYPKCYWPNDQAKPQPPTTQK